MRGFFRRLLCRKPASTQPARVEVITPPPLVLTMIERRGKGFAPRTFRSTGVLLSLDGEGRVIYEPAHAYAIDALLNGPLKGYQLSHSSIAINCAIRGLCSHRLFVPYVPED